MPEEQPHESIERAMRRRQSWKNAVDSAQNPIPPTIHKYRELQQIAGEYRRENEHLHEVCDAYERRIARMRRRERWWALHDAVGAFALFALAFAVGYAIGHAIGLAH